MKCFKCSKEAEIVYPNGDLCSGCFIDILSNRIKKEIRQENPFRKNEKVLVFGKLARIFLDKVVENLPLTIVEANEKYTKEVLDQDFDYDKIVIPWTADDEANLFYEELTKQTPNFEKIGQSKKFVKIFKPILEKELIQVTKILNISFELSSKNQEIEKIHKKYSSSKFGLVKTAAEFKKAIR